jgi:hypothetical protein
MSIFLFPGMTPELQAYLAFAETRISLMDPAYKRLLEVRKQWEAEGKPDSGPFKETVNAAEKEHSRVRQEVQDEMVRLDSLVPRELKQEYHKAKKEWYCRDESQSGEAQEFFSPSGRYRLVVTPHRTEQGYWGYSKGRVYGGDQLISTVYRNYSSFPHLFVEEHPNGHDYLVAGEDYQGQTVIELDSGRRIDYLPESAQRGSGFCWASYSVSPSKRTLAVGGCFWAAPYEVWFLDFSDPMDHPLPILHRGDDVEQFFDWDEDKPDTARIGRSYDFCIPLNKDENHLTMEELDGLCKLDLPDSEVWREVQDSVKWTRPSDEDAARGYIQSLIDGWANRGHKVPEEFQEMAKKVAPRILDATERKTLLKKMQSPAKSQTDQI